MAGSTGGKEAQRSCDSSLRNTSGATSSRNAYVREISDEEFKKGVAKLKKQEAARPADIVPCKSPSRIYAPFKNKGLEAKFRYPAGRMFAPGVIEFGRQLRAGFVGYVHEGRILEPASKSAVIKTVELAKEEGIKGLPYLLQEALVYEDLTELAGKYLARFYGSGMVDNQYALVVENVPGRMLQNLRKQEKAECRGRVLKAYDALHAAGYVQGDVSESNVLVDKRRVTIVDFGLAEKVAKSSRKIEEEMKAVLVLFD